MAKSKNTVDFSASITGTAQTLEELGFTASQVKGMRSLTVTCNAACRYLTAGTPTTTFGHYLPADETIHFAGGTDTIKLIAIGGSAAATITMLTIDG